MEVRSTGNDRQAAGKGQLNGSKLRRFEAQRQVQRADAGSRERRIRIVEDVERRRGPRMRMVGEVR